MAEQPWNRGLAFRRCLVSVLTLLGTLTYATADEPQDYRSRNFVVHTDLPKEDAEQLLEKMEVMLKMISRYWGAPLRKPVECYVVVDDSNWPPADLPAQARPIVQSGGITIAQGTRRGNVFNLTATVYASSKFGTAQHEAVHAYCYHTFGVTGPTWYAEGMAEMGNYWKEDDSSVTAPPYVIDFLKRSRSKPLSEITDNNQRTGDGWQNYAWRWALCHFLVNNPNYRDRFRQLGISYLKQGTTSFERAYASQLQELDFEFRLFMQHLGVGLNAESTAWNWKTRPRKPSTKRTMTTKVYAKRGWQATNAQLTQGQQYRFTTDGKWFISSEEEVGVEGNANGEGRLEAVLIENFQLSEPFELGSSGTFTAPGNGQLVLRCRDKWTQLNDNSGSISVKIQAGREVAGRDAAADVGVESR
ncbi:MAG: hypothetical protein NXI04_13360 [Planctomycetaceae bacterium]|nr:hypothetical protein [Planctomycetaceae bacterium]